MFSSYALYFLLTPVLITACSIFIFLDMIYSVLLEVIWRFHASSEEYCLFFFFVKLSSFLFTASVAYIWCEFKNVTKNTHINTQEFILLKTSLLVDYLFDYTVNLDKKTFHF